MTDSNAASGGDQHDPDAAPFRPLTPEQVEMLELSPNPKLVLDRQFRIRFINRVTAAYANVDRDALIGRNVWECYPELRDSVFHQAYQRVLDTGEPARFDRHEPETDRWQSVYAFPADGGVIAVLEDVTEQRRNIERLRESEETLRLAQEAANIGSFYRDLRSGESFWSAQLIRICGFEPSTFDQSRINSDPALQLIVPEDYEAVRRVWQDTIADGQPRRVTNRIRRADGAVRRLQSSVMLVRDDKGAPTRLVGTVMDVTEQHAAEEERLRIDAQMQQAQKLESLGVLAGGIAHDFNNLLVGILGNASLAMLEAGTPDTVLDGLQEIERSAQRAAELTRQLLAYAGKGRYIIEQIDVNTTIEGMAVLLRSAISRSVNLSFDLPEKLPRVDADVGQFRQVVMTLVTNASDSFGTASGNVQVATGFRTVTDAFLAECVPGTVAKPGPYVFVEVRDTGSGMDAETRLRMFEPFFSTKFTGRGLGLAATMGIMRSHRGAIRVQSAVGIGTTVTLYFPTREKPPAVVADTWSASGDVLVADDEASVRGVISQLLRRRGFTVVEAANGADAVTLFREDPSRWRLVLLDVTMPELDGGQAMRAMRALAPQLPVLLMSGYQEPDVRIDASDHVGFLQKPFSATDLVAVVKRMLRAS